MRSQGSDFTWILSPSAASDPGDYTFPWGHLVSHLTSAHSWFYFHFSVFFAGFFLSSLPYNVGGPGDGVFCSVLDGEDSKTPVG